MGVVCEVGGFGGLVWVSLIALVHFCGCVLCSLGGRPDQE